MLDLLEKGSNATLVASGVFRLGGGLANSAQWHPWDFSFRSTHHAVAWVAIGSLMVHVGVKLPIIRQALRSPLADGSLDAPRPARPRRVCRAAGSCIRRGSAWLSVGVAVLATAGSTVPALRRISVLGVRDGEGPQGLPINTTADDAGATDGALAARTTPSSSPAATSRDS